jgi:phosphoglucosamine mutase
MVGLPVTTKSTNIAGSPTQIISPQAIAADGLMSLASNPLQLPSNKLFGTDGIRGRVGDWLTASLALHVGYWAGSTLIETQATGAVGPVILGQDSRNSSDMLALALSAGLNAAGLEVWNLGLCPTPAVAYLTSSLSALGGVMISASHNPPEDNGIKFFGAAGTKLAASVQSQIETAVRSTPSITWANLTGSGEHHYRPELLETYITSLHHSVMPAVDLSGLRIVLDLAWGAAAHLGRQVFELSGAEVICIHDQPDGDRINVNCGSTHLAALKSAVQDQAADLGFAFDGDADRVMAVDATGRVVDGDYILYLWGRALQEAEKLPQRLIITTVMANLGFERAWQQQEGRLIRTAVGDQHVHAEMVQRGAMLGGEQSGHILCPHYGVSGDGMLTALHMATIVKQSGCSLSELVNHSFQTYPQLLRNVRIENRDRRLNWQQSEMLQRAIATAEADMGDQGRVLVRASGTEPVVRVMVEAVSAELVNYWTEYLVQAVQQYAA